MMDYKLNSEFLGIASGLSGIEEWQSEHVGLYGRDDEVTVVKYFQV